LSFFDEVDDAPRTEIQSPPPQRPRAERSGAGRRAPRRGGPPPRRGGDRQSVQLRRAIALGVLVVLVLALALGVKSCSDSATDSALQNYSGSVNTLIAQSDATGRQLFDQLRGAASATSATVLQNEINQTLDQANAQLRQAEDLNPPGQVSLGNRRLVLALRMRANGVANIASDIQPALSNAAGSSTVSALAADTAQFYASDVLYKQYAAPEIASAINAAGVRFQPLNPGQFLPSIRWLDPAVIAAELHVAAPGGGHAAHGHSLTSVSVNGTILQTGSTNTLPASPAPTFTLSFTNPGKSNDSNVVCQVSVQGTSVSGQTTVPQTIAGQTATCQVTLNSTPPTGTQTVTATVKPAPTESNPANNTLTLPVDFQ
jgi:hypothetical protein